MFLSRVTGVGKQTGDNTRVEAQAATLTGSKALGKRRSNSGE